MLLPCFTIISTDKVRAVRHDRRRLDFFVSDFGDYNIGDNLEVKQTNKQKPSTGGRKPNGRLLESSKKKKKDNEAQSRKVVVGIGGKGETKQILEI